MIGQAQRNLKMHSSASASFREYLNAKPEAPDKEEVERLIEELDFLEEAEGSQRDPTEDDPEDDPEADPKPAPKSKPLAKPTVHRAPTALTPSRKDKPVYKKWWFWVAVGGGLAVAGGTAGIVAWQMSGSEPPAGSLGNLDLP